MTKLQCQLCLGGESDKCFEPTIYDDDNNHFMFPNEARLRNMTYGLSIHYDLHIKYKIINDNGEVSEHTENIEKIYLGRFPIMIMSDMCILNGLDKMTRFNMGECKRLGYFIIMVKRSSLVKKNLLIT